MPSLPNTFITPAAAKHGIDGNYPGQPDFSCLTSTHPQVISADKDLAKSEGFPCDDRCIDAVMMEDIKNTREQRL